MSELLETTSNTELVDKALDNIRKIGEQWKNRITHNNLRFGERYLNKEIDVTIHQLFATPFGETKEFCAIFKYGKLITSGDGVNAIWVELPSHLSPLFLVGSSDEANKSLSNGASNQQMVLVNDVESMKLPKITQIPTFVRLCGVDEAYRDRINSLYHSRILGDVFGGTIKDRKGGLIGVSVSSSLNEIPNKMVKRTSQIVDNVANYARESNREIMGELNLVDFLSGIRIYFANDCISVVADDTPDTRFQLADVVVGPFDFKFDPSKQ